MGRGLMFTSGAVLALLLHPAIAQTPGQMPAAAAMPPGTQNPALAQPPAAAPAPVRMSPTPVPPATPPTSQSPAALIVPGGAGGLCECLINHDAPGKKQFDKTRMHQTCLANVDACQAACNTDHYYSFVPHAVYTCPMQPGGPNTGHIAMNAAPAVRLLSRR